MFKKITEMLGLIVHVFQRGFVGKGKLKYMVEVICLQTVSSTCKRNSNGSLQMSLK